jgi:hypothetical protein
MQDFGSGDTSSNLVGGIFIFPAVLQSKAPVYIPMDTITE